MITRSLVAQRKYVCSMDPAIDRDHPDFDWAAFIKDGDMKHLPKKEGAEFTIFDVAPLTRKQMMRVLNLSGLEQVSEAVAYGLRGVTNYQVNGQPVTIETQGQGDDKRLNNKTLDALFTPLLFAELGTAVIEMNRLDPL